MIITNNFDPIIFSMGPLQLRWYGLFFATGIIFYYLMITWLFKREKYELKDLENLVIYLFFGVVIGARLGHVIFYNADYYFSNPLNILKIWEGGLASHGAAIGLVITYLLWAWKNKKSIGTYVDVLVVPIPLAGMMVRIGNYFNSEIIGIPTNGDYGVIFAKLGENFARHPAQLYEALMLFFIFFVLLFLYKKKYQKTPRGFFAFTFVLLYFGGRFFTEIWKARITLETVNSALSMGQILSAVAVIISLVYFFAFFPKQKKRN